MLLSWRTWAKRVPTTCQLATQTGDAACAVGEGADMPKDSLCGATHGDAMLLAGLASWNTFARRWACSSKGKKHGDGRFPVERRATGDVSKVGFAIGLAAGEATWNTLANRLACSAHGMN
mmetsp:Transcript_13039/g.40716  ORF Transcript_13039/g.40716 Transcript_13039/m.40716 type:complete len:120 (+) Transcript_13039:250-609(+)